MIPRNKMDETNDSLTFNRWERGRRKNWLIPSDEFPLRHRIKCYQVGKCQKKSLRKWIWENLVSKWRRRIRKLPKVGQSRPKLAKVGQSRPKRPISPDIVFAEKFVEAEVVLLSTLCFVFQSFLIEQPFNWSQCLAKVDSLDWMISCCAVGPTIDYSPNAP